MPSLPSLPTLLRLPGTKPPPPPPSPTSSPNDPPKTTLASLPPELHVLIASHLPYPDALSLKHTNRYFSHLVDTGVRLKIAWLVERRRLHLECPGNGGGCDLGSDVRFCRGSVRLLMQRRREHVECESRPGLGCLISGTAECKESRRFKVRVRRWMRMRVSVELWGLMLAVVAAMLGVVVYWLL